MTIKTSREDMCHEAIAKGDIDRALQMSRDARDFRVQQIADGAGADERPPRDETNDPTTLRWDARASVLDGVKDALDRGGRLDLSVTPGAPARLADALEHGEVAGAVKESLQMARLGDAIMMTGAIRKTLSSVGAHHRAGSWAAQHEALNQVREAVVMGKIRGMGDPIPAQALASDASAEVPSSLRAGPSSPPPPPPGIYTRTPLPTPPEHRHIARYGPRTDGSPRTRPKGGVER